MRSGRSPNLRLPIAGELQGAMADGGAEGLVRREGGETFGLRVELGSSAAADEADSGTHTPLATPSERTRFLGRSIRIAMTATDSN